MIKIFLSHASEDQELALNLCEIIKTNGFECWTCEYGITSADSQWAQKLVKALDQSDKLLLVVTNNLINNFYKKGQVYNEVADFSSTSKDAILLFLDNVELPRILEYQTRKYQYIFSNHRSLQEMLPELLMRLAESPIPDKRRQFCQEINTPDYRKFSREVMRRYYGNEFFTKINDTVNVPAYAVEGVHYEAAKRITDVDVLCDADHSNFSFNLNDHLDYDKLTWYQEYQEVLDGTIKYPNRPGYMLDEMELNPEGKLSSIRVHIGTYAETVYSNHVLEYELYKAYQTFKNADLSSSSVWSRLRDSLKIRNSFHPDVGCPGDSDYLPKMAASLLKGSNRESLLSVQMMVIMKSAWTHEYELMMIQRSQNAAIAAGLYQLIPSGGFEVLNDSEDDKYDTNTLKANFSAGSAVFREFLEELHGRSEFAGHARGSVRDHLWKNDMIREIEVMLKNGTAQFMFLGSVIDLVELRQELSFVLLIDDEEYSEHRFITNEECSNGCIIDGITIKNFETQPEYWQNMHSPSAGMWYLFKKTELFRKLTAEESVKMC